MPRVLATAFAAACLSLPACDRPADSPPKAATHAPTEPAPSDAFRAIARAEDFLRALAPKIDPVVLRREHFMKGAKFYVEYLNAWRCIAETREDEGRQAIREFLRPIAARTEDERYHRLKSAIDARFDQDVISYLSACVLHRQFGFDTSRYEREIEAILPRILSPEHLARRGIDNTMAIVFRLRQLGHTGGPSFCELWKRRGAVTREHPDLTGLKLEDYYGRLPVYDMTHEIFYLTEFGATPMQCVSTEDLAYIRRMHRELIPIFIRLQNVDALAELVMCLNYLRWTDLPEYATARTHLLRTQNADGSWGDAEHIRINAKPILDLNPKYLVDVGQYLHTTQVALDAICFPLRRSELSGTTQPSRR